MSVDVEERCPTSGIKKEACETPHTTTSLYSSSISTAVTNMVHLATKRTRHLTDFSTAHLCRKELHPFQIFFDILD